MVQATRFHGAGYKIPWCRLQDSMVKAMSELTAANWTILFHQSLSLSYGTAV